MPTTPHRRPTRRAALRALSLTAACLLLTTPATAAPTGAPDGHCAGRTQLRVPGAAHQQADCLDELTTAGTVASGHTDPADYAELLARAGCEVDAWETTYVHILHGEDPVLEWYQGSGLRPVLAVLDADQAVDFLAEYGRKLRQAYPPSSFGTLFPFRRVFAVARRPG